MRRILDTSVWLRAVFVLLGSGLVLSLALLDVTLVVLLLESDALPGWFAVVLAVVLVVVPIVGIGVVPGVRSVEAAAAESLLGVHFSSGTPGPAVGRPQRSRTLAWFALHLLAGLVPVLLVLLAFYASSPLWTPVVLLVAVGALPVLGRGLAALAPALLGPSQAERIELLEQDVHRAVERNRLAREIHDSVGHALSLVTVQAAAASKVIDRDPAFAASALTAIEEAARSATADLDHALGLLREDRVVTTAPAPDLTAVDALLVATRAAGLEVRADVCDLAAVRPEVVSVEAYRIVQEGLTNAMRYADPRTAALDIRAEGHELRVVVSNPTTGRAHGRQGRGLRGIEERATALGGSMRAGRHDGTWQLSVQLPLATGERHG
ncbi:sensor histidine kinase [Flexivirga sp. B27]